MQRIPLYPLRFKPIIKEKIWGGKKLAAELQKETGNSEIAGESWEISGVEGDISVVSNGPLAGKSLTELIDMYQGELVGHATYAAHGNRFPILIKYIDADDDLSIQVHPNDELAKKRHNSFGKTEMWYIIDAEQDASLIVGFNKALDKDTYLQHFNAGKLTDVLNVEKVLPDDVFYLPAGRIHTIGRGLLIAEIQQTSDITYRIYDYDRTDASGNKRELHIEEALDAIDFNHYPEYKTIYNKDSADCLLADSPYFKTRRLLIEDSVSRDYADIDSCIVLMCVAGNGSVVAGNESFTLKKGDTLLIPNAIGALKFIGNAGFKLLEIALL